MSKGQSAFHAGKPQGEHAPRVELVREWAKRKEATLAQVSLAWALAQKPFIVPIPGTTNPAHLDENLGAFTVSFTDAELAELTTAASKIEVQGGRRAPDLLRRACPCSFVAADFSGKNGAMDDIGKMPTHNIAGKTAMKNLHGQALTCCGCRLSNRQCQSRLIN